MGSYTSRSDRVPFAGLRPLAFMNFKFSTRCVMVCVALCSGSRMFADDAPIPIQVPDGFRVSHFADDDVAHDIYSLTFNAQGQVVVSGPGYIRTLIDVDQDGTVDRFTTFANGPKTGAMGLCFAGPHLLASGDDGVLLYRDEDGDGRADGMPETILKIKAGGEHHVHAIRQGPDGWWYIIAGNYAGVDEQYAQLATSPVRQPEAGVLLRLKPDLSAGEIVADGFRNAYDFAFNSLGDVFAFDSDGERDVSLPWYQPCRVFHVRPGFHAGWVSRSWKRPNDFPDMQPAIAEFGRGSPTGVVCYRHTQFPGRYQDAIFALDWTFGRILALTMTQQDGLWISNSAVFAKGTGQFGFAPTDAAVAPDGSLFVSVGGRGSRGSVYRISYEADQPAAAGNRSDSNNQSRLNAVLQANQPLSAWSRERWEPLAKSLDATEFSKAAADQLRPVAERLRAIEVLTELHAGPKPERIAQLLQGPDEAVRARAAWAVGRSTVNASDMKRLAIALQDQSSLVQRFALEALSSATDSILFESVLAELAGCLNSDAKAVRTAATAIVGRLTVDQVNRLQQLLQDRERGLVALGLGVTARSDQIHPKWMTIAIKLLESKSESPDLLLSTLRLLQLSLGDVGPQPDRPAMFDGYRVRGELSAVEAQLPRLRRMLESLFPHEYSAVNREVIRSIAIVGSQNAALVDGLLKQITEETSPAEDIHVLAAIASIKADRTSAQRKQTAAALLGLEAKVVRQNRKIDSNWDDRLIELYAELTDIDDQLPQAIAVHSGFGWPGHVMFVDRIPAELMPSVFDAIVDQADATETYRWTPETVALLSKSQRPDHRDLLRELADDPVLLDAIIPAIARRPETDDRPLLIRAFDSPSVEVVQAAVTALQQLPRSSDAEEQFQLLSAAWRLHNNPQEYRIRENVIRLLQNNLTQSFGFVFGSEGYRSQSQALEKWRGYLQNRFPDYRGQQLISREAQQVLASLDEVNWDAGDPESGRMLFARLTCSRCHSGRKALGPDLEGVTKRFSVRDLFISIVEPNRDVPDRYQMTTIITNAGRTYSGLIVYESVDGVILRDVDHRTYRIEADEIEERVRRRVSLMPGGLLKSVTNQDLANLHAYLKSL